MPCLFTQEFTDYLFSFIFSLIQIIIYNHPIELRGKTQFKFSFPNAFGNHFRSVGTPAYQALMQYLYAWRGNKQSQCLFVILFFNIDTTQDINIKNNIFAFPCNAVDFTA